jgi:3-methyl-2-oxobutanoate hydroxymethyltransferase
VQGRERAVADRMAHGRPVAGAAGADIVLLECVPNEVGRSITAALEIPVIGIGAGPDVDGQILVLYDVLGITQGRTPRFVKNFLPGQDSALDAVKAYVRP